MPGQFSRAKRTAFIASITNQNQGGGNKKQGLVGRVGRKQFSLGRAYGNPVQRAKVFCINQIGGVGRGNSQTRTPADGVKYKCKGAHWLDPFFPTP
jgi:hypothetical protein